MVPTLTESLPQNPADPSAVIAEVSIRHPGMPAQIWQIRADGTQIIKDETGAPLAALEGVAP